MAQQVLKPDEVTLVHLVRELLNYVKVVWASYMGSFLSNMCLKTGQSVSKVGELNRLVIDNTCWWPMAWPFRGAQEVGIDNIENLSEVVGIPY